ncbi:MAG: methionine synthase [Candidatus Anammoximicrobium sp.]|nr:methionine synthase [Candidatus Anammoximicrobium sp.]
MHPLLESLLAGAPVLTDGAWGTQMQARGLAVGGCPDEWNLTHPETVEEIPRAYVEAGSQIVLTNTFRANRVTLADYGLADQTEAINRAGAEISRRAAGDRALVFASIGPSGRMLMMGEVSEQQLLETFAEQAGALAAGGAHALVIETMGDVAEAVLAVQGAKTTGLPVVACLCFDSGAELDRTLMGITPEQAAQELTAAGADVVGANCGQGIAGYAEICRRLHAATDRPIWIKPNAGIPDLVNDVPVWKTPPEEFGSYGPALVAAGASFLGGCCGTAPEFIRALREAIGR